LKQTTVINPEEICLG